MPPSQTAAERFPTLRQSLLSSFDSCSMSTKFDLAHGYLDTGDNPTWRDADGNPVAWSTHPQGRGQLFHRFAAKALAELSEQGEEVMETDVAHAILAEVLRQHDVPLAEVETVPMAMVRDLYWIVTKWAYDNRWSILTLLDVERRLEAPVSYPGPDGPVERILTGQIDALFVQGEDLDQAVVLDWKDTWALPPVSSISEEGFFQQRFYAWLIFQTFPSIQQVTLREFYVRYSEAREATVYRQDVPEITTELAALVERFDRVFDSEAWKPSPGKHCNWCLRPTACPIFATARGEGQIESQDDAERVAARLVVAKAAYDRSHKALKAWGSKHGPIPIKDAKANRVYGYRLTTRVERPKREQVEGYVGATLTDEDVDLMYVEKPSTRFEAFVPKDEIEPDDEIVQKLRLA